MSTIVLELQQDALNPQIRLADLLRKALVVARKLGIADFQAWIEKELGGYKTSDEIPEYRYVLGEVRGWNLFRGGFPVQFPDAKLAETSSKRKNPQAISEVEAVLEDSRAPGNVIMPLPWEIERILKEVIGATGLFFPVRTQIREFLKMPRTVLNPLRKRVGCLCLIMGVL